MEILNCFCTPSAWKKKDKNRVSSRAAALRVLQMKKLEQASVAPLYSKELKSMNLDASPPFESTKNFPGGDRVSGEELAGASDAAAEIAYEGGDEHEENASIKREFSDFDLQAKGVDSIHEGLEMTEEAMVKEEGVGVKSFDMIQSGHVSDPGIGRVEFWVSPTLKRSCSNLERRDVLRKAAHRFRSPKSHSLEQLWELSASAGEDLVSCSPASVMTRRSADRVMLKKHSSSQLLPSASRKLWWKLFLWSHRNEQKARTPKAKTVREAATMNQQGGYYSDTLERAPNQAVNLSNMESPGSFTEQSADKSPIDKYKYNENSSWDGFHTGVAGLWQQKQWIAFPAGSSSSFNRVNDWVRDLETESIHPADDANSEERISFPPSPNNGKSPETSTPQMARRRINLSEEILHANTVVQSLNPSSTVAYMSSTGLKAVPAISCFSSLKSVDLSNNFIVHVTPGSLPKGLHVLNLSRNRISTIEGLRELTRLRELDLSYNRISRIGHGLSNCTLIKELYLAGNKISDVEGLHRLLKLTVLDLSFNKITTTKALGQLVANYNSLLALNLLGNPIQSNINDDQLRKGLCSLLPKLTYLNKQPVKPQRAREVLTDSVAKAALAGGSSSSRRRAARRTSRVGSVAPSGIRSSAIAQKTSKNPKGKSHRR